MSAGMSLVMAIAISLCLSAILVYVLSSPLRIAAASPRATTGQH
jgi:hypothetical protein